MFEQQYWAFFAKLGSHIFSSVRQKKSIELSIMQQEAGLGLSWTAEDVSSSSYYFCHIPKVWDDLESSNFCGS